MPGISRKQALSELSLEVFRLTARLNTLGDKLARQTGLSNARWQLLGAIASAPRAESVAATARRMGLQRQSVQRTADNLAAQGLIEYLPNPQHQRAKLVALTAPGSKALAQLQKLRDSWAADIEDQLKLDKLQQARDTLIELRDVLDNNLNGDD